MSHTSSYNEWQQVTTSGTKSDNEWQRLVQQVIAVIQWETTSDNEWRRVTTNDDIWQRVTTDESKWERVVILANFPFFRIREEHTLCTPKILFKHLQGCWREAIEVLFQESFIFGAATSSHFFNYFDTTVTLSEQLLF